MNRWEFVNKNCYLSTSPGGPSISVAGWGTPGDSIKSIVENPSQFAIYSSNGDGTYSLTASAQKNLDKALGSAAGSSICNDLAFAITSAYSLWDERSENPLYYINGLVVTSFNSFNPPHSASSYEQKVGSFGDANTFYGVPLSYASDVPIRPSRRRPVQPPVPPKRRIRKEP